MNKILFSFFFCLLMLPTIGIDDCLNSLFCYQTITKVLMGDDLKNNNQEKELEKEDVLEKFSAIQFFSLPLSCHSISHTIQIQSPYHFLINNPLIEMPDEPPLS